MSDPRWERIEEIYHAALARDQSERTAFLQAACDGDEPLRREVESLLAEEPEQEFLAAPALEVAGQELASSGDVLVGQQVGAYQILSLLGAGGMGEVYRARDTKLRRDVAIKVLPGVVAHDPERVGRFAREARLLAALNHPHIAAIHGVEEGEGVSALVLELVEGETLTDRIARGPLAVADAIAIAKQITDGLEAAHATGIVHRDLKPSNIKVRPDGNVKILDFGLAKALAPTPGDAPQVSTASRVGMVTGTPAYMSPEQAQGQGVDQRADVWAFGCVFYEMLTGRQAFAGRTVTETLAAVMTAEPVWDALPRDLSPSIRAFLRRCLAKDVRQRVSDIRDMRLALEDAFETDLPATAAVRPSWQGTLVALGVVAVVLITGLVAWTVMRAPTSALVVSRLSMEVPSLELDNVAPVLDVSPDGMHIVYAGNGSLWLRRLDTLQPRVVPGTESTNAHTPVFSPDGQWVAFYDPSSRELKRLAIGGGSPAVIAATDRPFGVTWPTDDLLLYGRGNDGIWQVALPNGTPGQVIKVAEGDEAQSPQLLSNGSVLFSLRPRGSSTWEDARVVAQTPGAKASTVVVARGRAARYLPTGHLVYASSNDVLAAPFDVAASRILKDPVSVVTDVQISFQPYADSSQFAVGRNGTLVYAPRQIESSTPRTLVWVTRDGREEPLNLSLRSINGSVRVAPDGMRIAHAGGAEVFVSDIARPSWIPIVSTTGNWNPVWSHDSRSVLFLAPRKGIPTLVRARIDGSGVVDEQTVRANVSLGSGKSFSLTTNQLVVAGALTRDDRGLVFTHGTQIAPHLGLLDLNPAGKEPLPWKPIDRLHDMSAAALSPRGDWIAYHSQYSGQYQVYVDRFPGFDQPKQVSTEAGGSQPVWSADGREVFYRRADGAMMATRVETVPSLHIGDPVLLFESRGYGRGSGAGAGGARGWDLAPDGRFLMIKNLPSATSDSIVVVQNWTEELKRLVPAR